MFKKKTSVASTASGLILKRRNDKNLSAVYALVFPSMFFLLIVIASFPDFYDSLLLMFFFPFFSLQTGGLLAEMKLKLGAVITTEGFLNISSLKPVVSSNIFSHMLQDTLVRREVVSLIFFFLNKPFD